MNHLTFVIMKTAYEAFKTHNIQKYTFMQAKTLTPLSLLTEARLKFAWTQAHVLLTYADMHKSPYNVQCIKNTHKHTKPNVYSQQKHWIHLILLQKKPHTLWHPHYSVAHWFALSTAAFLSRCCKNSPLAVRQRTAQRNDRFIPPLS